MYLVQNEPPEETDPTIMRRRALIASALGLAATAAMPSWAEASARTNDPDATLGAGSWADDMQSLNDELSRLAAHYVTEPGKVEHRAVCETGLWVYSQAHHLLKNAPLSGRRGAARTKAEAAYFAAGCYLDFGNLGAADEMYHQAHLAAGNDHLDVRTFIGGQSNWVPLYKGLWYKVLRQADRVIDQAERHGGPGLLMGWTHRARAAVQLGDHESAQEALIMAERNIPRVPGAYGPTHALHYPASKVHFSAASTWADMGEASRFADARDQALQDPTFGWMDRQLLTLAGARLTRDPEAAAHHIRSQLMAIPQDGFAYCVKAEAERSLARFKAQQLTGGGSAGSEVRALGNYLSEVQVA